MLSPKSARSAGDIGYTNIRVFHDGLPVWKKGKNAVYSTVKGLVAFKEKEIPYVLVDVRQDTSGGFIPGAVAMPAESLEGMKGEFPKHKSAPVILYGGADESVKAFGIVRGWGFKNAPILDGGVEGWSAAGNSLSDTAQEKIAYVPKPRPGEFPVADFRKAAEGGSPDVVILDVRGLDETANGIIKGALNIPLTELDERAGELPAGKKVIAQCNTGAMAEMAYNMLKDKGIDAGWLNAKITIEKDGTYTLGD